MLLSATPRKDPTTGKIVGVIGVGQDITKMIKEKNRADAMGKDFQSMVQGANAPIIGVDQELKVTLWNNNAHKVTGFSFSDVEGKHLVEEFIGKEFKNSVQEVLMEALGGTDTSNYQFPLATKDCATL